MAVPQQKQPRTDIQAFKGEELVKLWLLPAALQRIALRDAYSQAPNPSIYLRTLRALPELSRETEPVFCLQPGVAKRQFPLPYGEKSAALVKFFWEVFEVCPLAMPRS